jgi:DNA-binding transcriptional LysR family regulator
VELNLHRLWLFMQVVECGGFSAAGQKLFMSQPSVSNGVRKLEQSLQVTLIDRSGARIRPTAEGEVLLEYAKRVFLLADEAVGAIRQVAGLQSGQLVVGGTTSVGTYLLPRLLAKFRTRYPGIECDIFVGNGQQVMKQLVDGEVGLAVFAGRPQTAQLVIEEVLEERLVLITSPRHQLSGQSVRAEALSAERFLLRERGSGTRDLQEEALERWGLTGVASSEMWGPETMKQAVQAGLGIALISEHAVEQELTDGRLGTVDVDPELSARPIVVAHRRDRLLSPAERSFMRLVRGIEDWPEPPLPAPP